MVSSLRFSNQNLFCMSCLCHAYYMPHPCLSPSWTFLPELQIPFCWTTNSILLNYKFHSAELQIPFCWTTNSILLNYKFPSAELQIPFCWTTNSLLLNYKFHSAELQISFCWTTNSVFNTNPWLSWILNQYYFPSWTMSSYNSLYSKPMTFQYSNKVITVHYRGLWCSI